MPTVLIADDEVDHRELLTLALRRIGYDVVTAADSAGALARLSDGGIDVALIDVRMPGGSGIELCRQIRSSPETELLPIMVISADVHRHQVMTALHAGADDFLPKPFSRDDLTARMETLLRTRPSAVARAAAAARAALLATRHALVDEPAAVPYRYTA
ncbi:response regulator [Actinoplanes sp. CA-252034]|uniref:response regulator n=1 Tax=Actinoplanes sp. CA-252034 TaxID=3239906 RepID=UPI003D971CCC